MGDWNTALILMHLWKLIQHTNKSTWTLWIKATVLKSRNFWYIQIPNDCSWIWRKVLDLRTTALQYIKYKIGNGRSSGLWFDPWLSNVPLATSENDILIAQSGLPTNAQVSSIINNNYWSLPDSNHYEVSMF